MKKYPSHNFESRCYCCLEPAEGYIKKIPLCGTCADKYCPKGVFSLEEQTAETLQRAMDLFG